MLQVYSVFYYRPLYLASTHRFFFGVWSNYPPRLLVSFPEYSKSETISILVLLVEIIATCSWIHLVGPGDRGIKG